MRMNGVVTVGIDAHKRKCVAACLYGDSNVEMFEFQTTREGLTLLAQKVPERTTVVIEASTTGKVISRLLSSKYDVHMVAPPERKPDVKTDERDAVRIAEEDSLGYLRRVYVPDSYVEEMRQVVMRQVQVGRKISRVKNQVHALLDRNMIHELDDLSDPFGVEGIRRLAKLELPDEDMAALATYLEELRLRLEHHELMETELARYAESDEDVAKYLRNKLQLDGWEVFKAPEDVPVGNWEPDTLKALFSADVFLVVYSTESQKSQQLWKEMILAEDRGVKFYPVVERTVRYRRASFPKVLLKVNG